MHTKVVEINYVDNYITKCILLVLLFNICVAERYSESCDIISNRLHKTQKILLVIMSTLKNKNAFFLIYYPFNAYTDIDKYCDDMGI